MPVVITPHWLLGVISSGEKNFGTWEDQSPCFHTTWAGCSLAITAPRFCALRCPLGAGLSQR